MSACSCRNCRTSLENHACTIHQASRQQKDESRVYVKRGGSMCWVLDWASQSSWGRCMRTEMRIILENRQHCPNRIRPNLPSAKAVAVVWPMAKGYHHPNYSQQEHPFADLEGCYDFSMLWVSVSVLDGPCFWFCERTFKGKPQEKVLTAPGISSHLFNLKNLDWEHQGISRKELAATLRRPAHRLLSKKENQLLTAWLWTCESVNRFFVSLSFAKAPTFSKHSFAINQSSYSNKSKKGFSLQTYECVVVICCNAVDTGVRSRSQFTEARSGPQILSEIFRKTLFCVSTPEAYNVHRPSKHVGWVDPPRHFLKAKAQSSRVRQLVSLPRGEHNGGKEQWPEQLDSTWLTWPWHNVKMDISAAPRRPPPTQHNTTQHNTTQWTIWRCLTHPPSNQQVSPNKKLFTIRKQFQKFQRPNNINSSGNAHQRTSSISFRRAVPQQLSIIFKSKVQFANAKSCPANLHSICWELHRGFSVRCVRTSRGHSHTALETLSSLQSLCFLLLWICMVFVYILDYSDYSDICIYIK